MEQPNVAPVAESATATPVIPETVEQPKAEPKTETISEALGTEPETAAPIKESRMVPEAVVIELKKELKALKRSIDNEASPKQVSSDIKTLADKHNIDSEFLGELVATIREDSKSDFEANLSSRLKPLEEKERSTRIDSAFETHFARALEISPEFKGVVNKDVIKTLSLDPKNSQKTFNQLIEESYGHLVQGKRTLDASGGNSRTDTSTVDLARAKTDGEYFKEVMANPALKKQYNDQLTNSLSSYL